MALRWGIASSGKICHDFVCAVQTLPSTDHVINAVAARNLGSAEDFAKDHNIAHAFEGYDTLAMCPDIDIVYIGVINTQHHNVAKMMLQNGKHVLCEKPLTTNGNDSRELIRMAKENHLFFMEAVWSRFFPVYKELEKLLKNDEIGDVKYTHVTFGFPILNIDRIGKRELGGSAILDLGVYALQFTQFAFRGLRPERFIGMGSVNEEGCDKFASGIVQYSDEKIGNFTVSVLMECPNEAVIVGTKGIIKIPNFWCPTKLILPDRVIEFKLPESTSIFNFKNSVGLSYEAHECYRCIKAGLVESPGMPHEESTELAELMEAWMKEAGAAYS